MSGVSRVALVLAGGGARGAYEAGALRFILTELSPNLPAPVRFRIICGTSAGALNGAYVAGSGDHAETARALSSIWQSMEISQVFNFTALDMLRSPSRLWQRPAANEAERSALLDAAPLHALVKRMFPTEGLRRRLSSGELLALAVSATEVATGRNLIFLQRHRPGPHEDIPYAQMVMRESTLTPNHVLASAAIPFLFPPVEVDGRYFVDGALRQNTPLSPALRLGAEKVLVIGVKRSFVVEDAQTVEEADRPPSLTFLMGKALNALTLDPLERDLKAVERYNALFRWGVETYGPDFMEKLNAHLRPEPGTEYRAVRTALILPRANLGRLAAQAFRATPPKAPYASRLLLRFIAESEDQGEADTLSYLLFDRAYTAEVERLGFEDARDQAEELARFFRED